MVYWFEMGAFALILPPRLLSARSKETNTDLRALIIRCDVIRGRSALSEFQRLRATEPELLLLLARLLSASSVTSPPVFVHFPRHIALPSEQEPNANSLSLYARFRTAAISGRPRPAADIFFVRRGRYGPLHLSEYLQ